jgi:hypothetical protein
MSDSDHHGSPGDGDGMHAGVEGHPEQAGEGHPDQPPDDPASEVEFDPQTEALIAAAEDMRGAGERSRPWRGPRNFLILGGVLLAIGSLTFYAVYFTRNLERQNAQIRMKALDAQRQKYLEERAAFLARGFRPAGEEAKPLTAAQFAELQALRLRFGFPPVPPEQAGTQPVTGPPTLPADGP